jgi:hypothetical protein
LLFVLALLAAAWPREGDSHVVRQAILWLPSGVAVAGLWLLGLSNWWIVVLCTLLQRLLLGYGITVALPAVAGSTAEAILGVLVLRRLGFQATVARLRDVLAVCVAAAAAPLVEEDDPVALGIEVASLLGLRAAPGTSVHEEDGLPARAPGLLHVELVDRIDGEPERSIGLDLGIQRAACIGHAGRLPEACGRWKV